SYVPLRLATKDFSFRGLSGDITATLRAAVGTEAPSRSRARPGRRIRSTPAVSRKIDARCPGPDRPAAGPLCAKGFALRRAVATPVCPFNWERSTYDAVDTNEVFPTPPACSSPAPVQHRPSSARGIRAPRTAVRG